MFLVTLLLMCGYLRSEDSGETQRRLERIRSDQQRKEQMIAEKEARKQQIEQDKQRTRTIKSQTDRELNISKAEAQKKLSTLNSVKTELQTVEEQLTGLRRLQTRQLAVLVRKKKDNIVSSAVIKEQHILALMAAQTRDKMNDLGDVQSVLSEEQMQKGKEFSMANAAFKQDLYESNQLGRKVQNLESEARRLTKEQQQLQNQIAQLKRDAAQLESLLGQLTYQPGKEPQSYKFSTRTITWPFKGRIIRSFGQETRSYGTSVVCNGIDIAAPEWSTIVAADNGTVAFAGTYGGQGKLLIIDHKNGFFTVYAYNNELLVSSGATVKKGQAIARSGMTGSASEPSVHFEVRKDGKAVNPLAYLD
jgi:murein hydrolase activator